MSFLYHYSKNSYGVLMTKQRRGLVSEEELKKVSVGPTHLGHYSQHVSFFIERPPLRHLGWIFGKLHPVWAPGSRLTEHQVRLEDLGICGYEVMESPEVTAAFYDPKYDKLSNSEWYRLVDEIQQKHGYIGHDLKTLDRVIRRLRGYTEQSYRLLPSRPNFDDIRYKYAATIPHLMVYPKSGEIPVARREKVTIENYPFGS